MERYWLKMLASDSSPPLLRPGRRRLTCTARPYLVYSVTCLSILFSMTGAIQNDSLCQRGSILFGFGLRTKNRTNSWTVADGLQSINSCHDSCCQNHSCNVFWMLKGTCILADCRTPQSCLAINTNSRDSFLVYIFRQGSSQTSLYHHISDTLSMKEEKEEGFHREWWKTGALARHKRQLSDGKVGKQPQVPEKGLIGQRPLTKNIQQDDLKDLGANQIESNTSNVMPTAPPSEASVTGKPLNSINVTESLSFDVSPTTVKEKPSVVTLAPVLVPGNTSTPPTPAPTSSATPITNKLVVSAGDSVEVTLPKNAVQLNAFVLPESPEGKLYTYEWRLITHPKDYSGEMEGKHSQSLKLSKLTAGLYEFKVIVDGENAHGEGFVNVTVKPEPRVNQPPVAIVSPRYQEISLPTTSTVIDGSQSTDDEKIVSYHWEELKGPLREEKITADTAILKLTNLVPGNYTFRLTVEDSDGARNSTTANLTVNKAVDYPPRASAGANQVITLPRNAIVLYGNLSTDDHGIVSYEWSLSPNSKGKVIEMQGVRTSTLQLSALQEGDYTFQLTVTDSAGQQSTCEVTVIVQPENNKPPQADAGPDKELTLPVDSTTLDGSRSTDDQKIVTYLWAKTRGPVGVKIENANSSIATVTGLQVGKYEFTLTVTDERGLQNIATVSVIVKEEINKPPVAKISGNVVITLPTNTAELDGSKSTDDKGIVSFQWQRDESSPAAGEVLNNSDHHSILFLSNLVEGTYTFHLKVTDAKGESDNDRTTVEVKSDPMKNNLVEIVLDVSVSQLTERQKGMFMRQIGVLLGVLDSDITVQKIQQYTEKSTKVVFFVKNQPPHLVMKGYQVACTLRNELHKQQNDFLIFRALEIDTFTCQLNCSMHGHCNSVTKRCVCDPFWMENFIRRQFGDGESNCDWSVLYVVITSFLCVVAMGLLVWCTICCCRRKKGKPKRKSRYKMLEATDDQESMELKTSIKTGVKLKPLVQNTSLMHSESELDSDDNAYTWSDREKGKLLRPQNGSLRNGQASHKNKTQREELL
ncbi:dyslexia-associated protein KIAA0319-like protein homolog isoform 1-T2 [Anomaloglossus baeobatrachus]|uniref:dyslexia-associated protein KIAA0319-like protein homolog n=1 Tax=Anomaloglossus baeobatrachus TaxID=238106 RepID=UPI003F4F6D82